MAFSGPRRGQRRKRTVYNSIQHQILTQAFEKDPYPDISAREKLAELVQVPEPRIQVWFQNQRARKQKDMKKKPSGKAKSPGPGSHQGGVWIPDGSSLQGLLPRSDSSVTQSYTSNFSWEWEDPSGQATPSRPAAVPGIGVASSDMETLNSSGGFHCYPTPDFSFAAEGGPPASQQLFSEPEAGSVETHLEYPRSLVTGGDWALQGWGQHPPSSEQLATGGDWALQGWGQHPPSSEQLAVRNWQHPPVLEPQAVPQQSLYQQHPNVWEQLPLPPPPSAQELWPDPTDTSPLWLYDDMPELPAGHQEQFPFLPESDPQWGS